MRTRLSRSGRWGRGTRLGGALAVALVLTIALAPAVGAAPGRVTAPPIDGVPAAPAAGAPGAHRATGAPGPPAGRSRTVTLITGDRVTVTAEDARRAAVARGPGRSGIGFVSRYDGGHLHLVPTDAMPLIRAGALDGRLFDITALLSFGYDRDDGLPLIVSYRAATARPPLAGMTVTRDLPAVHAMSVRVPRASTTAFWSDLTAGAAAGRRGTAGAVKIWLDGLRQPVLDVSVPRIGAPAAWAAGYTGTGVSVAVLDTGIDASHPDLAGRIDGQRNFTDGPLGEDDLDRVGHGTHVASTVAGTGAAAGGSYRGVAPGARLLDGKVCVAAGCAESWILAGMQWAAAERGAKVVNMSLSGPDTPDVDVLEQAVNDLSARYGTLFVVAAGNTGTQAPVGSPATADAALAVGAVTDSDALAYFSARGPRTGDGAIKPEITAPGVDITAARGRDGRYGVPGESYATVSGTSMAAPHVAGSAAILAQARPDWTGARLKAALMGAADPYPGTDVFGQGAGRVDVARAVRQRVTAEPASLNYGRQAWPHSDDDPIQREVAYHNDGPTPVTLTLAVHATGPDGTPTPAGMFSVDPARVTVAPGGNATVTVTADTRRGPDGLLGGHLTATGGDVVVRTPLAVDKEVASYTLTLSHIDRGGQQVGSTDTFVSNLDRQETHYLPSPVSPHAVRLPKGRYVAWSVQIRGSADDPELTMLVLPELTLDRDRSITFDGRVAKPVRVTVPRPVSRSLFSEIVWSMKQRPDVWYGGSIGLPTFDRLFSGQVGPDRPYAGFASKIGSTWGDPVPNTEYANIPVVFVLAWFRPGRMHTGFQRRVTWGDLATIRATHHSHIRGGPAQKNMWNFLPGKHELSSAVDLPFSLPFTRTEYVNNDGGAVRWATEMVDDAAVLQPPLVNYRPGRTYREVWNNAAYTPAFPDRGLPGQWVNRRGDTLSVRVPFYGDGAGHPGFGVVSSARTTLFRDGVRLHEQPGLEPREFALPAAGARYRLEMEATRGAPVNEPFTLSTHVTVAWTFRSGHVDGPAPTTLPLAAIRFTPPLDATNTAPAGRKFTVPVSVRRQAGAGGGRIHPPAVEVSYDDGATWCRVGVRTAPDGWAVDLVHPKAAGFVSLRATAADDEGNTVEQTVIHAYQTA